jgi:hypothetical protein
MHTVEVRRLASFWLGWRYAMPAEAQEVPYEVDGYPRSLVGTGAKRIDCSSFCAWILMAHYALLWDREAYEALQIYDAAKPFSNIDLLISRGISPQMRLPEAHNWHLVQTWEGTAGASPGHSRLAYHDGSATALCLESTESSAASGPQWRRCEWSDLLSRSAVRIARV